MATQPFVIPITTDIKGAQQGFQKLQRNAKRSFSGISKAASNLGNVITGFSSAVDLAKGALDALDRSMQAIVKTGQQLDRANFFGVQAKEVQALQRQFDGAITKAQSLNTLIELQASGVGKELAPQLAKAARALSFVSGLSRSELLQQLSSGDVSDEVLQKIGVRAGELALATQQRANALDRELTKYDKVQIALGLVNKGAARLGTTIDSLVKKDVVSPITKLRNSLSDIGFGVLRSVAPAILNLVNRLGGVDGIVRRVERFVKNSLVPFIEGLPAKIEKGIDKIKAELKAGGSLSAVLGKQLALVFFEGIKQAFKMAGKYIVKNPDVLIPLGIGSAIAGAIVKGFKFAQKKLAGTTTKPGLPGSSDTPALDSSLSRPSSRQKAVNNFESGIIGAGGRRGGRRRGVSRAAQELAAERAALQSEARALTRNFLSNALDAISNLGGTISGVFSSLRDLPEKARVFLSTKRTREALLSVLKIADKPLRQQLQLIRQNKRLTDQQKQSAVIFAIQSKAGLDDAREYLRNQNVVTKELKAQNSFLQSNAQQAAIARLENDRQTDVVTNLRQLDLQLQTLLIDRQRLVGKISKQRGVALVRSKALLQIIDQQIARTGEFTKAYAKQNELQKIAISFQRTLADLERQQEIARAKALSDRIRENALLQTQEAKAALLSARGFGAQATLEQQRIAAKRTILDLDQKILETNQAIQKTALQAAADALKGNTQAFKAGQVRVKALQAQKTGLEEQRDLQKQVGAQLVENARRATTFAGGLQQAFADAENTARNFSNALGQQLGGLAKSAINFATDSLVRLGEGLGQLAQGLKGFDFGADFRKRALSFLSDLAVQLGSFFITAGTGLLLTGDVARGPALIGIGAALATGGGFAKAFAGGGGASASTAGLNAIRQSPSAAPTRQQQTVTQETYILFNRAPWSLGTPEQEFRQFKQWQQSNSRTVGAR